MPTFTYTAIDSRGKEKSGRIDATDAKQGAANLRRQGLFPTALVHPGATKTTPAVETAVETKTPSNRAKSKWARSQFALQRVSSKERTVFTRQLATLLRAGMPLLRGLEVLARQERNQRFRETIEALVEGIRSGDTLSEAMAQHPKVFERLYLNMVRAGEAGGLLDVVLERIARFQEKSLHLRGKIVSATIYPVIVMAVAVAILVGLLVFVVPKFKQIFADLLKGAPLPPLTQLVLTMSDAVKVHYPVVLAVAVGGWIGFKLLGRVPAWTRLLDGGMIRLPLFGELILKGIVARFSRTLGTLLSSGVPILPALLITRDTCGNARVAAGISEVHDRVKEGVPIARPLDATRIFPPMVTSMIEVGEQTGQLPEMLGKIADIYEEEVDNAVAGLSSLIEPILILFLALVVGTIVIALFLPIVRIVQLLT